MRKYSIALILIFGLGFTSQSFAQSARETKKIEKEAKKTLQMQEDSIANQKLRALVSSKAFVLEANILYTRTGESFNLNSTTNFVGFDGKNSTIQLAFNQLSGYNGVGGVTLDGTISIMEIVDNKNGLGFTVNITVKQNVGAPVILIFRVSPNGNARVTMSGTYGDELTFQGKIVSLDETRVYKGIATY